MTKVINLDSATASELILQIYLLVYVRSNHHKCICFILIHTHSHAHHPPTPQGFQATTCRSADRQLQHTQASGSSSFPSCPSTPRITRRPWPSITSDHPYCTTLTFTPGEEAVCLLCEVLHPSTMPRSSVVLQGVPRQATTVPHRERGWLGLL